MIIPFIGVPVISFFWTGQIFEHKSFWIVIASYQMDFAFHKIGMQAYFRTVVMLEINFQK